MSYHYRRAYAGDFANIVALQNKNLISAQGVLATAFTAEQFKEMDRQIGVAVYTDDEGNIHGYLCASTIAFNKTMPIPAAMITHCSQLNYEDKPLSTYHWFIPSPACIAQEHREQGVFVGLVKTLKKLIPTHYELAITFVASHNQASLKSCEKIGFKFLDQFEINNILFFILVCPMNNLI